MYTGLALKGLIHHVYVTSDYLLGVALKKFFSQKQADIKIAYLIRNATKIDLYRELSQILGQEQDLGFTSEKLPNREWLINVLYIISPNHRYFYEPSQNLLTGMSQQDIQKLKELNTSLFRTKILRFFKTTLNQRLDKRQQKLKDQMNKLKTQLEEDKMNQTNRIGKLYFQIHNCKN
ncbi:unnamed protein product [Paramecium primaurelia]|uniref:Uncharacterized protein n=1 Tax=Paramecium primaurelia TaxID=5886 RepID=A0A8S1MM89_PARPR|nr:unnamed protein product [Paramecium primaurelia]